MAKSLLPLFVIEVVGVKDGAVESSYRAYGIRAAKREFKRHLYQTHRFGGAFFVRVKDANGNSVGLI